MRAARGRAQYLKSVAIIKEHIVAGDVFQAVVSESFSAASRAGPFAVYRAVRAANITPYGFCLLDGERAWIGATPERLVRTVERRGAQLPDRGDVPARQDEDGR